MALGRFGFRLIVRSVAQGITASTFGAGTQCAARLNIAACVFCPASSDHLGVRPRDSSPDAACFAPGAQVAPPPCGDVTSGVSRQASASANPGTSCDSHSECTDTR
jgi:hypothetical protein